MDATQTEVRSLTPEEYKAMLNLFHHFNEAFKALPDDIIGAYYKRLYRGA